MVWRILCARRVCLCSAPARLQAQLEGSKGFTKDMCLRGNIPTGGYVRTTSLDQAMAALEGFAAPYVLKADGLAAGKGVVIAPTKGEAVNALTDMFGGKFGDAGAEVVIEEFPRRRGGQLLRDQRRCACRPVRHGAGSQARW